MLPCRWIERQPHVDPQRSWVAAVMLRHDASPQPPHKHWQCKGSISHSVGLKVVFYIVLTYCTIEFFQSVVPSNCLVFFSLLKLLKQI